jgi:hypothetical protein
MDRFVSEVWIEKVDNEEIPLSHATKDSDYDEWKTALQFYENSLGTNEGLDRVRHGVKFICDVVLRQDKSSATKDLSIAFNKRCPISVCKGILKYMKLGMSEYKAYKHMMVDREDD